MGNGVMGNGAMEQWSNGAMEQWSNGAMEQWSNGAMEQCRIDNHGQNVNTCPWLPSAGGQLGLVNFTCFRIKLIGRSTTVKSCSIFYFV